MSTKIFGGRRVKPEYLQETIAHAREEMFSLVIDRMITLIDSINEEKMIKNIRGMEPESRNKYLMDLPSSGVWHRFDNNRNNPKYITHLKISRTLGLAVAASKERFRNPLLDLECGINMYPIKDHLKQDWIFIIPWGEYWITDRMKWPDYVEEYGYWNNTDRPDELSYRQWERRGREWDKAIPGNHLINRLAYYVVDLHSGNSDSFQYWYAIEKTLMKHYGYEDTRGY